jgi:hypothetical protein
VTYEWRAVGSRVGLIKRPTKPGDVAQVWTISEMTQLKGEIWDGNKFLWLA